MTRAGDAIGAESASTYEPLPYARHGLAYRLCLLGAASVWWALGAPWRRGWVVLCYHGVRDDQVARFTRQIALMRSRVGNLREIDDPTPRGVRVALTFDDAFENLLRNALPALRRANVPATVFVVTGNLGATPRWSMPAGHPDRNEPVMSVEQVAAIAAAGYPDLGTHTHTHPSLDALDDSQIRVELEQSINSLESMGATSVRTLAAPHGAWDTRVARIAHEMGLRLLTLEPALARQGIERVGRFSSTPDMWSLEFWLLIRGGYAFLSRLRGLKTRKLKSDSAALGRSGVHA